MCFEKNSKNGKSHFIGRSICRVSLAVRQLGSQKSMKTMSVRETCYKMCINLTCVKLYNCRLSSVQLHRNCTNDNLMKKVSSQTGIIGTRSVETYKGSHLSMSFLKTVLDFVETKKGAIKNIDSLFKRIPISTTGHSITTWTR